MESLSIKKTGKVFLAVALVIFMLVALLGLSMYGHAAATASADDPDLVITAEFTDNSATAHTDSTETKLYYNQLASGTGALPLAVNDTFTVTYSFTVNSAVFTGAKALDLTNAGFDIVSVTVGSTNLTTDEDHSDTVSGVVYTMSADGKSRIGFDGAGDFIGQEDISNIVVVYKLTSAIDTYSNKTIGLSGEYSVLGKKLQAVASNTVAVYVRSTASITTTSPAKTYDATAATTSTTFTPAVSDTGNESRRSAIVTTWSAGSAPIDAGDYNVAVSTAANDYYEATAYNTNFTIAKKAITITADDKTSVYLSSSVALTYSYSPIDFYGRDGITVSYSGAGASVDSTTVVGTYTITPSASGTGIGNYTVTPVNGTYTVTRHNVAVPTVTIYNDGATTGTTIAAGSTEEKTFNGKAYSFNYTVDPTDANSIAKYTHGSTGAAITNVGTSTLTLTLNENYYWGAEGVAVADQDTAAKSFTIQVNKAEITVTLHHDAIEYLDAVPTTGYYITAAEYLFGENVSTVEINQADFSTAYTVGDGLGTYNIAIADTNGSKTAIAAYLSNYNVTYTGTAQLTVGAKHISVAANWIDWATGDSATMTYDAAAHGIVAVPANYTYASTVICDVAFSGGDSAEGAKQLHVNGNELATTLTATFTVKSTGNDGNGNAISTHYVLDTTSTSKDIIIQRYAVTITADDKATVYGSAAPAFTTNANAQLLGSDTWTTAGSCTSAYSATKGNANRVVNSYDIVPSGWANNDYAISYTNGTLTVNKKVVTFTWSDTKTWVYDAGSHTISATVVGAVYDEEITVDEYSGNASATDVGNYSRTVTSLSDDDNYAITTEGTQTEAYSITQKAITITITPAEDLVYTSADKTVFTVTVSGMIGTETLTYTFDGTNINEADGTFTLSNASETFTGMLAQGYGLELTAVANGTGKVANYSYSLPSAAANTIAKATFTPGAISYSGATVSWLATTGVQGSDVITFTYTVNKGATEKQSSTSSMSYTAAATGNDYVLAISFAGDRAANYNAIADQALLEVFSVTLADTSYDNATYGHPHNGEQIASVTQYAFDGETVPGVSDWAVAGYDFKGWYVDATDRTSAKFAASDAVTATVTYVASWDVVTYNVTYKYKLAGADSWETYKTNVVTTYWTALETVPSNKWFSNVGWNDAEAMNGATKTILDYTSDRTYYTVYSFAVKNGDVDGSGSITAADATIYRQYNVGGYSITTVASIDAAWAITDVMTEYAFAVPADETYFLQPVSDVDADGEESTNDIFYIINSQIGNSAYAAAESTGVVIKIAAVTNDTTVAIPATPTAVKVAGADASYSYNDGVLTLNTALTSGQKLEVIINRVKYVYTKA